MIATAFFGSNSWAGMKFNFQNEEIAKVIEVYSKATGQKFVVDGAVRGKATILGADNLSAEEALNMMSAMLATNGYAIAKKDDLWVVDSARKIQRDLIEVTQTLPALKPERMVTYVYTLQHVPAGMVMKELRILSSRDGEVQLNPSRNQLIFTDWVSNLHRVDQLLKQVDVPADPKKAHLVEPLYNDHPAFTKPEAGDGKRPRPKGPPPPKSRLPEEKEVKD